MAMPSTWKVTVVGGDENGMDFTFPANKSVLIGRSRSADLRLKEPDVSGRHVELFVDVDGTPQIRNLSRYTTWVNSREMPSGATLPLAVGDTVELGRRVRVRVDAVPRPSTVSADISAPLPVPTAVMEESMMTSPGDGTFTGTRGGETGATHLPDATLATRFPAQVSVTGYADETIAEPGVVQTESGAAEDGETCELETRVGSFEEVLQRRRELERRARLHKVVVAVCFVFVALFLAALWFISRTTRETREMAYPADAHGRPDSASYILRDANGLALVKVDFPRHPKMDVNESSDSNGVSVLSFMGRDRDVPFYLQLDAVSRREELEMDLMSSVRAWFKRTENAGAGFVFDERMKDELRPAFFEDAFPGSCQSKSLYGVRFVTFEYKRTWQRDGRLWHGVLIYFRSGDTVYVLRREIPELYWERGAYRIRADPNLAIYSTFIDSYWESPGMANLPIDRSTSDLMASIRTILSKERASDWPFLKRELDATLVKTWRDDPKTRDLAQSCLRQFREVLRVYYYGKYNAYMNAKDNHDVRRMNRVRLDCQMVFDNPDERYYFLVGNPEVW